MGCGGSKRKRKGVYEYFFTLRGWERGAYLACGWSHIAEVRARCGRLLQDRAPGSSRYHLAFYDGGD
eukprot:7077794-Pyramimonas_sp.AAC.1